jgi:hypothetical protein
MPRVAVWIVLLVRIRIFQFFLTNFSNFHVGARLYSRPLRSAARGPIATLLTARFCKFVVP